MAPFLNRKKDGWHIFPEESGHGYASSRSGEQVLEDEGCRPYISRRERKYGRNVTARTLCSNGLCRDQKCDRENSLALNDWKPVKRT